MMNTQTQSLQPLDFLKLLAHELRWQLLSTLSHSDYRVQELVTILQEPQNLVSYHLKQLRNLRIVTEHHSTADARDIYYSLDLVQLQAMYDVVGASLHPALKPDREITETSNKQAQSPVRILFLCTENSARSQMAEGILRHLSRGNCEVFSAGTAPGTVHSFAIRTLDAMGIDISQQRAKHVDEYQGQSFDYVVTVCDRARENCPVFPGDSQLIHWSLRDPAAVKGDEAQYSAFEETAQQLESRIRYFLAQINSRK